MKTHLARVFAFGLLSVSGVTPALAQGWPVTAAIPFAFTAANGKLPAGTYTVTDNGYAITLRSDTSNAVAVALVAQRTERDRRAGEASLVFHRYGSEYFLAQVIRADDTITQVVTPKSEKRLFREWPDRKRAQNTTEREVVAVRAARR